jgi:starch synthase
MNFGLGAGPVGTATVLLVRIGLLTREYPPDGLRRRGGHVEHLVPALRELVEVDVHCFGEPRDNAYAHPVPVGLIGANFALQTLGVNLAMVNALDAPTSRTSHTWYANMGRLPGQAALRRAARRHGALAGAAAAVEGRAARRRLPALVVGRALRLRGRRRVIAVSEGMRADVLDCYPALDPGRVHVVHNGIDTDFYHPDPARDAVVANGIDPDRPSVVFVGRITRQKGVGHLIAAAHQIDPAAQIVLCAGAPDTPEIAEETEKAVAALSAARSGVVWVRGMLPTTSVRQVLSASTVFVCPSVYEPLGIVNLEAMACGTAVVASDVGGIPEVVDDGRTGLLVHFDENAVEEFRSGLAASVNELLADPARAAAMGAAGRERAEREFAWETAAGRTVEIYNSLV